MTPRAQSAARSEAPVETAGSELQAVDERTTTSLKQPGLHLMGDLYDCTCAPHAMTDLAWLRERCLQLVARAGLTASGHYFHAFDGAGVTGAIVLSESHMSVHTWPEHRYATVDVYVCNYSQNNRPKARELFDRLVELFGPQTPRVFSLDRA